MLAGAMGASAAVAQLSGTLSALSDYRYRGVSLSQQKPAVQASVGYDDPSGFYGGLFGSTVELAGESTTSGQALVYLGWVTPIGGGLHWDLGGDYSAFSDGRGYDFGGLSPASQRRTSMCACTIHRTISVPTGRPGTVKSMAAFHSATTLRCSRTLESSCPSARAPTLPHRAYAIRSMPAWEWVVTSVASLSRSPGWGRMNRSAVSAQWNAAPHRRHRSVVSAQWNTAPQHRRSEPVLVFLKGRARSERTATHIARVIGPWPHRPMMPAPIVCCVASSRRRLHRTARESRARRKAST